MTPTVRVTNVMRHHSYSASAPVTASTTAASAKNAIPTCPTMNFSAYTGESALSISG